MNPNTKVPRIKNDDVMYLMLRDGRIAEFNDSKAKGTAIDLVNCDFRGLDLRGMDAEGLDLSGAYFRQADLRGVDLSRCRLEGASIHATKISGAYFPAELSADEITLSLLHGTRMRYASG